MAEPVTLGQASFVAALAVHQTASHFAAPASISLKWPNDCLLDGAKFCGILAEVLAPGILALGIGINIAHVPDGLPYQAERLAAANVESAFRQLSLSLSNWLEIWDEGRGFPAVCRAWEARCQHIGQQVSVEGVKGTFLGLAQDGALLLRLTNGECKQIYAGDVRVEYQKP